jgi:hypothetical protein
MRRILEFGRFLAEGAGAKRKVLVNLAEEHVGAEERMADLLAGDGLEVTDVWPFGVVAGMADEATVEKIRAREGVDSVDDEKIARPM